MKKFILVLIMVVVGVAMAFTAKAQTFGTDFQYWAQDTLTNADTTTYTVSDRYTRAGYNWAAVKLTEGSGTGAGFVNYYGRVNDSAVWVLLEQDTITDVAIQYHEYWAARPVRNFKIEVITSGTVVEYVDVQTAYKKDE